MSDLYKINNSGDSSVTVYGDRGELKIHKRPGKNYYFVCYHGQQVKLQDIPEVNTTTYPIYFGHVFEGTKSNWWIDTVLHGATGNR